MTRGPVYVEAYEVIEPRWRVRCEYCRSLPVPGNMYPCKSEAEAHQMLDHHCAQDGHVRAVALVESGG